MAMKTEEVLALLCGCGALLEPTDRHFVLNSGRHSPVYVEKDTFLPQRAIVNRFVAEIVNDEALKNVFIDVVCGPAHGGITVASRLADMLEDTREMRTPHIYSIEKEYGRHVLKFPFIEFVFRKNVLIAEDILTTGKATRGCINAVREAGGTIVGVAACINRGNETAESLGVPLLVAAATILLPSYPKELCFQCKEGISYDGDHGKGAELNRTQATETIAP